MSQRPLTRKSVLACFIVCLAVGVGYFQKSFLDEGLMAQPPVSESKLNISKMADKVSDENSMLLTVILRHDQSKTLDEIREQLEKADFWKKFPPEGIKVESWYVMMGIGHVVTLRVPPDRVRDVNLAIEQSAWKAFRTEFYLTYDYKKIAESRRPQTAQ